ncbi:MAG: CBS domain-containing protein [Phycisphaerae bacterium]|nr:CBS domain-containing protein [Phycisphaerae bacterium]
MFKTRDFMTQAVICTREDMPIYDAIRILANRNITALPVVDEDLRLVGLVSEKDVLRLLYDKEDRVEKTVADYMNRKIISFDVNANLIDICDCLMQYPFRRIPITERGRLAGIASTSDVIRAILKLKHQELPD